MSLSFLSSDPTTSEVWLVCWSKGDRETRREGCRPKVRVHRVTSSTRGLRDRKQKFSVLFPPLYFMGLTTTRSDSVKEIHMKGHRGVSWGARSSNLSWISVLVWIEVPTEVPGSDFSFTFTERDSVSVYFASLLDYKRWYFFIIE